MADVKEVPKPWERQEGESDEAWLAFRHYREMIPDERKIKHAAARSTPTLSKWYRDHNWADRCKAYDAEFDKISIEERQRMYRRKASEVAIDHMVMLSDARSLVTRELAKLNEVSAQTQMHGLVKVNELQKLMDTVVKLDRLVRGESTENVQTTVDYSNLSPEELDTLQALMSKASKKDESSTSN